MLKFLRRSFFSPLTKGANHSLWLLFQSTRNVKHLFSLMPKLPIFQLDLDFFGELGYKKILADHENFTTLFWLLALGQSNMNGASKPSKKKVYLSSILLICMMMCEKAPLCCKKCPELLTNDLEEKQRTVLFLLDGYSRFGVSYTDLKMQRKIVLLSS